MTACLPKASDTGDVPSLGEGSESRMSTGVRVGEEEARVAREAVSAQAVQHQAQFAQQFDAARVALCVNVAVDVMA